MDHNLGGSHRVSSCQEYGCSVHRVQYEMPLNQISKLISLSSRCFQEIQVRLIIQRINSYSINNNCSNKEILTLSWERNFEVIKK